MHAYTHSHNVYTEFSGQYFSLLTSPIMVNFQIMIVFFMLILVYKTVVFAMVFNPTDQTISRNISLPLYYTGISEKAVVMKEGVTPGTPYTIGLFQLIRIHPHGRACL